MANVDTLELVSQENGLIKLTPAEETIKKIAQMKVVSVRASNNSKISRMSAHAFVYVVQYLRRRHYLSDDQIRNLSSEDLNRIPEMIFADRGKRALLLGWAPLFGWIFAGKYLLFKSRVKYLRQLDENMFDAANIEEAIRRSYEPVLS